MLDALRLVLMRLREGTGGCVGGTRRTGHWRGVVERGELRRELGVLKLATFDDMRQCLSLNITIRTAISCRTHLNKVGDTIVFEAAL